MSGFRVNWKLLAASSQMPSTHRRLNLAGGHYHIGQWSCPTLWTHQQSGISVELTTCIQVAPYPISWYCITYTGPCESCLHLCLTHNSLWLYLGCSTAWLVMSRQQCQCLSQMLCLSSSRCSDWWLGCICHSRHLCRCCCALWPELLCDIHLFELGCLAASVPEHLLPSLHPKSNL